MPTAARSRLGARRADPALASPLPPDVESPGARIEAGIAALLVALVALRHLAEPAGGWWLAPAALLALAGARLVWTDLRQHRIPNSVTAPLAALGVAGLALDAAAGARVGVLVPALLVAGVLAALAATGGIGMGDAKLVLGLGLASPTATAAIATPMLAVLIGGLAAVPALLAGRRRERQPFGPALLLGWAGAVGVDPLSLYS
ncbi:prepilin peptidase [Homoserinibacter sp. YIM 151385]|uniref:prepilin peptidase n=1 Tax=Homoserinibacter sp. YIM 151385 TaxID=2985506 RepID=UPI0022EFF832|nr:A24 family peptidase [Homoserinibacter sp. YIM 151385]WBU38073.1 A24 family peptidase [Homoserinibacter sp. YIM 151385]